MYTRGDHAMPQSVPRRSNAGHVGGESVVELPPLAQQQPDLNGVRSLFEPERRSAEVLSYTVFL